MGKAGKWVMNFLLGKKEGKKGRKTADPNGIPVSKEDFSIEVASHQPPTPSNGHRRRWSFGKSSSKDISSSSERHNSSSSFNPLYHTSSEAISQFVKASSVGSSSDAVALALHEAAASVIRFSHPSSSLATDRRLIKIVSVEHAAATRIQSVFRSYLAKKALGALKGLVKLQAVARGHLVRKHMSATIRKMHAVMSIQVRARFHRIQTTTLHSSNITAGPSSHNNKRDPYKEKKSSSSERKSKEEVIVSRSYSGEQEEQRSYEESSYYKAPQRRASFTNHQPKYPKHQDLSSPEPNYMSKTQSSMAKTRSHSEPKQRPRRSVSSNSIITRASPTSDGTTNSVQDESQSLQFPSSTSQSDRVSSSHEQWFVKLYRPPTPLDADYYPIGSDREILVACEPHLNLY